MNAVILCPGPSLARLAHVPPAKLVVGVNRAAIFFRCDAWAGCDLPTVEKHGNAVIGAPELIAAIETIDTMRDHKLVWRGPVFDRTRMLDFCPHAMDWVLFSATTALIYAAYRAATHIDVYGADWSGELDFDGVAAGETRGPERWQLEAAIWQNRLVPWLAERGVTVTRH